MDKDTQTFGKPGYTEFFLRTAREELLAQPISGASGYAIPAVGEDGQPIPGKVALVVDIAAVVDDDGTHVVKGDVRRDAGVLRRTPSGEWIRSSS